MINDLITSYSDPWKFIDDTTIWEILRKNRRSTIQLAIDKVQNWTEPNLAELNEDKSKELKAVFQLRVFHTYLHPR